MAGLLDALGDAPCRTCGRGPGRLRVLLVRSAPMADGGPGVRDFEWDVGVLCADCLAGTGLDKG